MRRAQDRGPGTLQSVRLSGKLNDDRIRSADGRFVLWTGEESV